jgi:hypothetical protein
LSEKSNQPVIIIIVVNHSILDAAGMLQTPQQEGIIPAAAVHIIINFQRFC